MLDNHIALVNGQIQYYRTLIDKFNPANPRTRPGQVEMYRRLLQEHLELLEYLELQANSASRTNDEKKKPLPKQLTLLQDSGDDLEDLPEEVRNQLSARHKKAPDDSMVQIIKDRGGIATLDDIIIDLYRKHKETRSRTLVSNQLYRLSKQGLIQAVEGKRGVYTAI